MANRKYVLPGGSSSAGPIGLNADGYRKSRSGTSSLSNGSGSFASGTLSFAPPSPLPYTPTCAQITAHEGNTLGTAQSWSASGITVTLKNVNGSTLGTVGFSYTAEET